MQIASNLIDEASLKTLGADGVDLLCKGNFTELARRFGYALSYGREPAAAIQEDLAACLTELRASTLAAPRVRSVKYFGANETGLFALVECLASVENGAALLVEFIVTAK